MKKLSLAFGIIGNLFLLLGLYELFTQTEMDSYLLIFCFIGGAISSLLSIVSNKTI